MNLLQAIKIIVIIIIIIIIAKDKSNNNKKKKRERKHWLCDNETEGKTIYMCVCVERENFRL